MISSLRFKLKTLLFAAVFVATPFSSVLAVTGATNTITAPASASVFSPQEGSMVSVNFTVQATTSIQATSLNFVILTTDQNTGTFHEDANFPATSTDGQTWNATWDSRAVGNGPHGIEAVATLPDASTITSSIVNFTVGNETASGSITVSMSSPSSGTSVSGVAVAFQAQTNVSVQSLNFAISENGNVVANLNGTPDTSGRNWTAQWDSTIAPNGTSYSVKAFTTQLGSTPSQSVFFAVNNISQPPPSDQVPLTVSVSVPTAGQAFSASATFSASTNKAADGVNFVISSGTMTPNVRPAVAGNNGTVWTLTWDTKSLPNGSYALVARGHVGSAEASSPQVTFTVSNQTQEAPFTVHLDSPLATASLSGNAELKATTSVVADAVVFRINGGATSMSMPGTPDAERKHWTFLWDTKPVSNGTYALSVAATRPGANAPVTVEHGPITVAVNNANASAALVVTIAAPASAASISSQAQFQAATSVVADSLEFIITQGDVPVATLTAFPDTERKKWTSSWNTREFPNGTYSFIARAKQGITAVQAGPQTVAVNNSVTETPPIVTIMAPPAGSVMKGSAPFTVTTSVAADGVQIFIRRSDATEPLVTFAATGDAAKTTWTGNWDTTRVANGPYMFEAKAKKGTAVIAASPISVTVENAVANVMVITLDTPMASANLAGRVQLKATTSLAADSVRFVFKPVSGAATLVAAVPNAEKKSWTLEWDSATVPDGVYAAGASAMRGSVTAESRAVGVSIKNGTTTGIQPRLAVGIKAPLGGQTVSGTVLLKAETNIAAEEVAFSILSAENSAIITKFGGTANDLHSVWGGSWDSTKAADGAYRLVARAKKGDVFAESALTVIVKNHETSPSPTPTPAPTPTEPKPPESTPTVDGPLSVSISNPGEGVNVRGSVPLIAKARGHAGKVAFVISSPASSAPIVTKEASFSASNGAWGALWDTTRNSDGPYSMFAVATSTSGEKAESGRVSVTVTNTAAPRPRTTAPSPVIIIPREVIIGSINEPPEGTKTLLDEHPMEPLSLPQDIVDKTREAAGLPPAVDKECVAAGVPAEKCEQFLAFRHQSDECRKAGIVTKEECLSYLDLKHGGQHPACVGKSKEECDGLRRGKIAGLLSSDDLRKLGDAAIDSIGDVIRILPKKDGETNAPNPDKDKQLIIDNVPLTSNEDLHVRIHGSPSYAEVDGLGVRQMPAVLLVDTDSDGLPDDLEARLKTDPKNPDSDGDSFSDFTEVKNGYNPLGGGELSEDTPLAPIDRAVISGAPLEQPKTEGMEDPELLVEGVSTEEEAQGGKTTIGGKAAPGEVVTIYIYSYLPVVLTTTADADGNWSYDLESSLTDGQHEAYVAVTDETGKIKTKSSPLSFFVNSAQAASPDEYFGAEAVNATATAAPLKQAFQWYAFGVIGIVLLAGIVVAVILLRKLKKPTM